MDRETPETLRADIERLRTLIARQTEQNSTIRGTLNTLLGLWSSRATPAPVPTPAPPPRPQVRSQPPPAPSPLQTPERRPVELPGGSTVVAPPAAPKPSYRGPKSGRLIWSGFLPAGQAFVVDDAAISVGSVSGRLPGVPVRVTVSPGELTGGGLTVYSSNSRYETPATEEPGPNNAWNATTIRYDAGRAQSASVVESPRAANGWKKLMVRANGRPLSVVVVSWSVVE